MSEQQAIFDKDTVRRKRRRALGIAGDHDFLQREVADRLADRLLDITRSFPLALDLGCRHGIVAEVLAGRGGIETLLQADIAPALCQRAQAHGPALCLDEEFLPFAEKSFDLIISNLALHWVNDLPGTLLQANRSLKPDGFFLASVFGGESLRELRTALMEAEMEVEGGVSPRVSPLIDVRDAGALLQRAGFALPVTDVDTLEVSYETPFDLMKELRGMGETNSVHARRKSFTRRDTLLRAAQIYQERFAEPDGRITATFDVIYLAGWAPHESQQAPLRPGSAAARLAEALQTEEQPVSDSHNGKE